MPAPLRLSLSNPVIHTSPGTSLTTLSPQGVGSEPLSVLIPSTLQAQAVMQPLLVQEELQPLKKLRSIILNRVLTTVVLHILNEVTCLQFKNKTEGINQQTARC